MTPSEKALKYAEDVVNGKIPNCKWVRLAAQRFLSDIKRQGRPDFPYVYDHALGDRVVNFIEMMPHVKGKWARDFQTLKMENWQCFIECNLFGWIHKETGNRRFRTSFELIPRKNAKSTRVAARGIYLFALDNESGSEVYSGATSEKQAHEVFKPAWLMVHKLEELRNAVGIEQTGNPKNVGTMYTSRDMSKFEVMIGKPGDGASPHGAIVDEYHEHDSDHMVDTMQTGMGAREQPLLSIITTAGSNLNGPCFMMQQDMQRILEGVVKDETAFAIMYGIDEQDKWDDPASLIKANPNYGVSINPEFLLSQLEQAKRSASKQNSFRTKHLNEWVGAKTAWMNMTAWMKQVKMVPVLDADGKPVMVENEPAMRVITMEDCKHLPCHVATDLSSKKDAVAVDITFKDGEDYITFKKIFVPEAALEENEKYLEFSLIGCIEITEGFMTDQEVIEEYLLSLVANGYRVRDFAFDAWNADYLMTRLAKNGLTAVKFPFRTQFVSGPMKTIEALVLDGKYWHNDNACANWMVGNVAASINIKGDTYPNKARPSDEKCKIDAVATAIMSMGRWMVTETEGEKTFDVFFI